MARIGFRPKRNLSVSNPAANRPQTPNTLSRTRYDKNPQVQGPADGHQLKRRNEGLAPSQHRFNSPQVMASNNAPDVKPHGQISGAQVNATHGLAGSGHVSSLAGSDPSAPASYRSDMAERIGVPAHEYKGAPHTKAEKKFYDEQSFKHDFRGHSGSPGHNGVVLNDRKANVAYVRENGDGRFTQSGSGELSYTSAAARVEDSHQGRFGRTEWKGAAEGPAAKLAGEYELRANKNPGEQALAAHAKAEGSASLYKVSGNVDHKFSKNFGVGAHGFSEASAFSSNEASLVADRKQHTYMGKLSSANIAGVQAGGGVSGKVGPFQGDVTAAKLVGVGHVFNVGGGVNRGVYSGVVDLGGAMGAGGRLRVGASFDGVEAKDSLRNAHNRMTNPHYSQEIRDKTKGATLEERAQFDRQSAAENELFNASFKQQIADQRAAREQAVKNATNVEIPSGTLGTDMFNHIW